MESRDIRLSSTGFIILIISLLLLLNINPQTDRALANRQENIDPPLLLNSGLVDVTEAKVEVIFWFEEESDAQRFLFLSEEILSEKGWEWKSEGQELFKSESKRLTGRTQAQTISGYRLISSSEEEEILNWFRLISKKIEIQGGKAYLDERVEAGIDAETYLRQNNFELKQKVISGKTASFAAWQEGFSPGVQAGQDVINLQLLSRNTSQGAKTVLAIPVLLEEF